MYMTQNKLHIIDYGDIRLSKVTSSHNTHLAKVDSNFLQIAVTMIYNLQTEIDVVQGNKNPAREWQNCIHGSPPPPKRFRHIELPRTRPISWDHVQIQNGTDLEEFSQIY